MKQHLKTDSLHRYSQGPNRLFLIIILLILVTILAALAGNSTATELNQTPEPIEIGAIYSLTGWGNKGGQGERDALIMAVDDANSKGGLLGRQIKLYIEDNASDLKTTATAAQRLLTQHQLSAIIGPNYAEFSEVVAPIAQSRRVPMITSSGFTKTLTVGRPFVFTILPAHSYFTAPLTTFIKSKEPKLIAILKSTSSYFDSIATAFREQMIAVPAVDTVMFQFNPGERDFRSALTRLKDLKPDGIFLSVLQGDISTLLRQLKDLQISLPLYSSNSLLFDEAVLQEPNLAEGIVFFDYSIRAPQEFMDRFRKRFGYEARDHIPRTYAAFEIWAAAVIEAQSVEPLLVQKKLQEKAHQSIVGSIAFDSTNNVIPSKEVAHLAAFNQGRIEKVTD